MIDEQIRDGDFVVVEDRKSDNGEMVIALVRGSDVTLEVLSRSRRQDSSPAGKRHDATDFVDPDQVQIQGVVVGVMRVLLARAGRPD
jgi:repressor LexA